ncbi:flagellar FlbD family protein [Virgibacillus litoralis]|uniref:Flagellar protein FlbD n=1 Tax=Virgibacillus litoralis TaxID=578221 RepID=A0ABS4HDZ5_9BACI|nr:flagellar FlbD family protein [Virgibacillus litoralis]MBP1949131.1 flagellar protein FlbD [Virgibacillus litoralis]
MVQLTRLNGELFLLNAIMIEQIQSHPDTTITLMNGKKIVVKDSESEVQQLVTDYYRKIGINGWFKEVGDVNER